MIKECKYLILGAGPAGLTFAYRLLEKGEKDFLVLEQESEAGGLCRSAFVCGAPLDIGGGHFLDTQREQVTDFIFRFLPENEWILFERDSKIHYKDRMIGHPFESNIWQMDIDSQIDFLESIALAGSVQNKPAPESFVEWISWKLGTLVAEEYMLPYNAKMFGENLNALGTYWLEKLPDVSFRDTLRSCLEHKAYGKEPGHAQFYYPARYGYGEVWLRIADALDGRIAYNCKVSQLDADDRIVTCDDGKAFKADRIITSIPWNSFILDGKGLAEEKNIISSLRHTAVDVEFFPDHIESPAHWIYEPDPKVSYHRILLRENFCQGSSGYWTETNEDRIVLKENTGLFHHLNRYAYPLNTVRKDKNMAVVLSRMREREIYGIGRWGEHCHYNSDVVVEKVLSQCDSILDVD